MKLLTEDNWREKLENHDIRQIENLKEDIRKHCNQIYSYQERQYNILGNGGSFEFQLLGAMVMKYEILIKQLDNLITMFGNLRNEVNSKEVTPKFKINTPNINHNWSLIYKAYDFYKGLDNNEWSESIDENLADKLAKY